MLENSVSCVLFRAESEYNIYFPLEKHLSIAKIMQY